MFRWHLGRSAPGYASAGSPLWEPGTARAAGVSLTTGHLVGSIAALHFSIKTLSVLTCLFVTFYAL
jgi:hypothetical protein